MKKEIEEFDKVYNENEKVKGQMEKIVRLHIDY